MASPPRTVRPPKTGTCVTVPGTPAIPAIPGVRTDEADYGWNSGANSVTEVTGDAELRFNQPLTTGAVIGLVASRDGVGAHDRMTHAFYFHQTQAGRGVCQVMERGVLLTGPVAHTPGDLWAIRRVGGTVTYLHNGSVVYRSRVPSVGTAVAGCALYASGDAVPTAGVGDGCFWTDITFARQVCGDAPVGGMFWVGEEENSYMVLISGHTEVCVEDWVDVYEEVCEPEASVDYLGPKGVVGGVVYVSERSDENLQNWTHDLKLHDCVLQRAPRDTAFGWDEAADAPVAFELVGALPDQLLGLSTPPLWVPGGRARATGPLAGTVTLDPAFVYRIKGLPTWSDDFYYVYIHDPSVDPPIPLAVDVEFPDATANEMQLAGVSLSVPWDPVTRQRTGEVRLCGAYMGHTGYYHNPEFTDYLVTVDGVPDVYVRTDYS